MLESMSYYIRYLIPLALSALNVLAIALINYVISRLIWGHHATEPFEVFGYSVHIAGPFAFAISFIFYYYGLELLQEQWNFAKIAFISSSILMAIGLVIDIIFIPRMR